MPTTTIGTFHSAATSTGNGSSLAVPSGDIVLNVSLVGSGPIGAVIQPQVSADNSTWVDLQPSTRIAGAGSVSSMVDVATTAAYIRVVLSEISGTNAAATVTLASFAPAAYASLTRSPDGSLVADGPIIAPGRTKKASKGSALFRVSYPKYGTTTITSARTYDEQWPAFGEFTGLRVGLSDNGQFSDQIDLVAVATPAIMNNQGSGLTWTPAYFGGKRQVIRSGNPLATTGTFRPIAASGVVIGQPYFINRHLNIADLVVKKGGTTLSNPTDYVYLPDDGTVIFSSGTVVAGDTTLTYGPANSGVTVNSDLVRTRWSDHINLKSAARTDGGKYPLIRARTYCRGDLGGGTGLAWFVVGPSGINTYDIGTWFGETGATFDTYASGDIITTPGNVTIGTTGSKNQCSQFLVDYVLPSYDVAIYGDSIANGASTIDCMSPVNWAAKLAFGNGKYVLSPYNAAIPSRTMKDMHGALAYDLVNNGLRPAFAVLQAATGNNGNSDSIAANFVWLSRMLELCDRYGVVPIIETLQPHVVWNTPDATVRHTYNTYIRSMAGVRAFVLDSDLIVRDPANIDAILPAYAVGVTEPHINVAGEQAKAAALYQMLDQIIGG